MYFIAFLLKSYFENFAGGLVTLPLKPSSPPHTHFDLGSECISGNKANDKVEHSSKFIVLMIQSLKTKSNREFETRRLGDICGDCDATKGNLKRPNINFTRRGKLKTNAFSLKTWEGLFSIKIRFKIIIIKESTKLFSQIRCNTINKLETTNVSSGQIKMWK